MPNFIAARVFTSFFATGVSFVAITCLPWVARAQVSNDWLNTTSGNFSTAVNWATNSPAGATAPADGIYSTNILRFFGAASYDVTNDFATVPFQLHGLRFQVGGATSTLRLSGGQLEFLADGANPAVIYQNGIGRIAISNDILANTDLIFAGGTAAAQRGTITNSGVISGTGALIKAGIFTNWIVNAANSFQGGYIQAQGRTVTESGTTSGGTPLGTGPITLTGGTLSPRMDGSNVVHVFGPGGSGYSLSVISNATFDVGRQTSAGTNVTVVLNTLSNQAVATLNVANGFQLRFDGAVTLNGTGSSNRFNHNGNLLLQGVVGESLAGSVLDKSGGGRLWMTNLQNQTYSGGTIIRAGQLRIHTQAGVTAPLGTGADITMFGGSLELRDTASRTIGTAVNGGNGYNLIAAGTNANVVVDVNRFTGNSQNSELRLNNLALTNGASFQVNGGNNYTLGFLGGTRLGNVTNNIINVNNGRNLNPFSLRLVGPITSETPATAKLIKQGGYQELGYVNLAQPDHEGGTWVTAGGLTWRPAALPAGTYGFGTGAITLDNGASFRFQNNQNNTYTLANDFILNQTLQTSSGRANYSGGRIDTVRQANNPRTTVAGNVLMGGDLKLNGATGGAYGTNQQALTLTGTTTVRSDDLTLFAENDGDGTGERIVIRGPLTSDNLNRRLNIATLNGANLELSGDNSGLGSIFVMRGYVGNVGYVKFATTNSLPANGVTVAPGAVVGVGLQQFLPNASTPFSSLSNSFNLAHGSIVLLDRTNVNGTLTYGGLIDLSATGLDRDIRIGVGQNYTTIITNSIIPFATTYKLGGGEGVLQLTRTNQLTGGNRLNVGPDPGFDANEIVSIAPLLGGTVLLNTNNDFTGGAQINPGSTLDTRHTNALGSGAVVNYGVLSVRHGGGTLTSDGLTNLNSLTMQAGSTLQFENNDLINLNRFGDAESVTLNASTLRLLGRNSANQVNSEAFSNLVVNAGSRLQTDQRSTGGTILFALTNISRGFSFSGITNGTLQLVPNRDGVFGTTNRIVVADTSTLGIDHNGMVAPWMVNQGAGAHYLTYSTEQLGGFDVGLTNFAGYLADISIASTGDVVNVIGFTNLAVSTELWALRFNNNSRLTNNGGANDQMLTIRSGGVLAASGATNDAHLVFRDGDGNKVEGLIYANGTLRLNGTNDASVITKFGDGTLALGAQQPGYTNGWNVNRGTLSAALGAGSVATAGTNFSLGSGDASNFINLNGGAALSFTSVGTNIVYASGKITSWDNNALTSNLGNQDDRHQFIAPQGIDLNSISNGPLGSQLRVDLSRTRSALHAIGPVTLNADAILNIRDTGGASGNTGATNRFILDGGLVGSSKLLVKIGNGVLELPTDNSGTFTSGEIRVNGGALSVGHNGALGDAATIVNVASNAVLELNAGLVNFAPVATVNQAAGSAERWKGQYNRFNNSASAETYAVATNVTLQISVSHNNASGANNANKTIRLQGGGLEGWQFTGDNRGTTLTISNNVEFTTDLRLGRSGIDVGRGSVVSVFNGSFTEVNPGLDLVKVGGDIVQLGGGAKNYTGDTLVQSGELRIGAANGIRTGGALELWQDGRFNLNNFAQSVAGLSGSGILTNSGGGAAEVFTINSTGSNAFAGSIGGIMALTKSGSGTQTLTGASGYSGGTIIDGGTLLVNNTLGSGTGSGAVQVRTNGTLGGSGFIAGSVTNLGGTIAPGNSPGILGIGGNFTATNFDSVAVFEIAGSGGFANAGIAYDQIAVGGDVDISGSAMSILTSSFAGGWQLGDQYTFLDNQGANPILGFFTDGVGGASLFNGSSVFVDGGGVQLTLDYFGGTGNDLVLTVAAVPEPQTVGLMIVGGVLCAWHVMRRRRA